MRVAIRSAFAGCAALVLWAAPLHAQRRAPSGVTSEQRGTVATDAQTTTAPPGDGGSRLEDAAKGALIGTAAGLAVGALSGYMATKDVRDHSEDGMTYALMLTAGAVIGFLAGAIVGAVGADP